MKDIHTYRGNEAPLAAVDQSEEVSLMTSQKAHHVLTAVKSMLPRLHHFVPLDLLQSLGSSSCDGYHVCVPLTCDGYYVCPTHL